MSKEFNKQNATFFVDLVLTENNIIRVFSKEISGGKVELLEGLYYILGFPDYFGFNFDSLEEILQDSNWCGDKKITLLHEGLPKNMTKEEIKTYIEILYISHLENPLFSFCFDTSLKSIVEPYL